MKVHLRKRLGYYNKGAYTFACWSNWDAFYEPHKRPSHAKMYSNNTDEHYFKWSTHEAEKVTCKKCLKYIDTKIENWFMK